MADKRRFQTWVDGPAPEQANPLEGFTGEVLDPMPYETIDDVPRPVRVLIAQAALLRGVPVAKLAELYAMPAEWIDAFIEASTPEDMEDLQTKGGIPLGTTEH